MTGMQDGLVSVYFYGGNPSWPYPGKRGGDRFSLPP
jgi:hypothetical protein